MTNGTIFSTSRLAFSLEKKRLPYPKETRIQRRMVKGQTEIIIILAVVIVAAVGVLLATRTISLLPPEPESVSALKNALRADLERRISADATEIIRKVTDNGGYLDLDADPAPPATDYIGKKVAFWQYGNATLSRSRQDFETSISKGLKESLKKIDPKSFENLKGKNLEIQSPRSVDVKISNNDITIKVDLPVYLEGYGFDKPMEAKVSAKLGEAIDFANGLIGKSQQKELQYKEPDDQGIASGKLIGIVENRFFERFLINAIRVYDAVDMFGNPIIPSEGIMIGCEVPPLVRSWSNLKPEMQNLVQGVLENTYTAGKVPKGVLNTSRYPSYVLPLFTNLDVKFTMAKDLDERSFQVFQNNSIDPGKVIIKTENFAYTSVCMSPPYRVLYFLLFPVVAEIGDENFKLRLAFHTYVNGYQPGDFADTGLVIGHFEEDLKRCASASCPAKITAMDSSGFVPYAEVTYSYCNLGKTDSRGVLETDVPCGIGQLDVFDNGHGFYRSLEGSDSLKDKLVFLSRQDPIKIHIYNIELYLELTQSKTFFKVSDVKPNTESFTLAITPPSGVPVYVRTNKDEVVTNLIPSDTTITLSSVVQKGDTLLGGTDISGVIPAGTREIWLYNPVLSGGYPQKPLPNPVDPNDPVEVKIQKSQDPENQAVLTENLGLAAVLRSGLTNVTYQCGLQQNVSLPFGSQSVNITKIKQCAIE